MRSPARNKKNPMEVKEMKKAFNLYEELKANGFYEVNDEFGDVLRKDYEKEIEVAWYGKQKSNFLVRVRFNASHSVAQVAYYHNTVPVRPFKEKTHLNEKRALNAIRQTVENNGFEL